MRGLEVCEHGFGVNGQGAWIAFNAPTGTGITEVHVDANMRRANHHLSQIALWNGTNNVVIANGPDSNPSWIGYHLGPYATTPGRRVSGAVSGRAAAAPPRAEPLISMRATSTSSSAILTLPSTPERRRLADVGRLAARRPVAHRLEAPMSARACCAWSPR